MPRKADHEVEPMFLNRWSSRALNGEPVPVPSLLRLFEAARWAPSSANSQPWRFLYAQAGTPDFQTFFELLDESNRAWCVRAGALLLLISKTTFKNGKPTRHHGFDSGAAWMGFALQGSTMGLVTHAMAGFDAVKARASLGVPADHELQCMIAVGFPGRAEDLVEKDRAREVPNDRRPVAESAQAGRFPEAWQSGPAVVKPVPAS